MNNIYNMCDFILSLGYLEEGFGLTTVECIMAGRYVISYPIGATISLLPKNSGIIFAGKDENFLSVFKNYENAYENKEVNKGIKYIKNHYTEKIMLKKYLNFIKQEVK